MAIWTAVIWLRVRVPVLSELSAEVEPSVSTERRRFMIAPASASVCEPFDRIAGDDRREGRRDGRHRERDCGKEQLL